MQAMMTIGTSRLVCALGVAVFSSPDGYSCLPRCLILDKSEKAPHKPWEPGGRERIFLQYQEAIQLYYSAPSDSFAKELIWLINRA